MRLDHTKRIDGNKTPNEKERLLKRLCQISLAREFMEQREYKQVNFYMRQHNARYGYILTDTELVAVRRLEGNGRLAVSAAVPWTRGGVRELSVLLALWYLGMLAAEVTSWILNA